MYFDNWSEFLTMGGHGLYVWSAYAIALVVLVYNLLAPFLTRRRVLAQIRRQQRLANNQKTCTQKTTKNSHEQSRSGRLNKDHDSVRRSAS